MTPRHSPLWAAGAALAAWLACAPLDPASAHDLGDIDAVRASNRDLLNEALQRGGEAERAALAAELEPVPGADERAVQLGRDLDGDGDADEIHFHLEVVEVQEEVYPGEFVTFWVFAPVGTEMSSPARLPSPTLRVEEGDHVAITLYNTHYLPHTIHLHGLPQDNNMDGVPHMTQHEVEPGRSFTYRFIAKNPGTYWYHCHVQEQAHIGMGLAGMLIVEPNRPNNHFAHVVPGAGRILSMGKATREQYQNEYSLVYMDIDDRLHRIPAAYGDPREIEKRMHRDYDVTQARSNIFLLNGRSFPFTLRDSPIVVNADETTKLRILNVGPRTVFLHTHGHHPTLTDLDGYALPKEQRVTRDTFEVGPGQRADLALRTGNDGYYAAGPGVWLMHDHAQPAATNKGINPGGDHTAIVYSEYMGEDGLPRDPVGQMSHHRFFDPAYYQGKVPVFDPKIFGTTEESYERDWPKTPPAGGPFAYPARAPETALPRLDLIDAERHRTVATACQQRPRGFRRIVVKAGRKYARAGEVFAFEPREIHAERCEEVEIVLENNDEVRHDFMIPGLSPMFAINFVGPDTESARFVTPDEDVTLPFHCHVPIHEKVGMLGRLVVGKGGEPKRLAQAVTPAQAAAKTYRGVGVVIAAVPRAGRLIVNHEPIKGYMGAMEMSYPVAPPTLLNGLNTGDKIGFTVDAGKATITAIEVIERAK